MNADIQHTVDRISKVERIDAPTPLLTVDNLLSDDLFAAVVDQWPDDSKFKTLSELGRGGYDNRLVIQSRPTKEEQPEIVARATKVLTCSEFCQAVFDRFKDVLLPLLKVDGRRRGLSPSMLWTVDKEKYAIKPHTDLPSRAFTLLFYVETNVESNPGTWFLSPEDKSYTDETGSHKHPGVKFLKERQINFKANSCVIFPRTNQSFHAVEEVPPGGYRKLIIGSYTWTKPE